MLQLPQTQRPEPQDIRRLREELEVLRLTKQRLEQELSDEDTRDSLRIQITIAKKGLEAVRAKHAERFAPEAAASNGEAGDAK